MKSTRIEHYATLICWVRLLGCFDEPYIVLVGSENHLVDKDIDILQRIVNNDSIYVPKVIFKS
jgi:hypothetical protein